MSASSAVECDADGQFVVPIKLLTCAYRKIWCCWVIAGNSFDVCGVTRALSV